MAARNTDTMSEVAAKLSVLLQQLRTAASEGKLLCPHEDCRIKLQTTRDNSFKNFTVFQGSAGLLQHFRSAHHCYDQVQSLSRSFESELYHKAEAFVRQFHFELLKHYLDIECKLSVSILYRENVLVYKICQ